VPLLASAAKRNAPRPAWGDEVRASFGPRFPPSPTPERPVPPPAAHLFPPAKISAIATFDAEPGEVPRRRRSLTWAHAASEHAPQQFVGGGLGQCNPVETGMANEVNPGLFWTAQGNPQTSGTGVLLTSATHVDTVRQYVPRLLTGLLTTMFSEPD